MFLCARTVGEWIWTRLFERAVTFLPENAGPVIRYRLKKKILGDFSECEEEALIAEICALPSFRLLLSYVKHDGWVCDNWRGQALHEPLIQNGGCAARLLSYYHITKTYPAVQNLVAAMRDEGMLRAEF